MKEAFQIPHIDEVRIHIKARHPEWPDKFIEYYAERFWNFYQSNGWKVSGKAAMKDWKAAFASQWNALKFSEDKETLIKMGGEKKERPKQLTQVHNKTVEWLDLVLLEYKTHPAHIEKERLASCYDWMKEQGLMKLTDEQKGIALGKYKQDKMIGKAIAVQFVFDKMANNLLTFSEVMQHVQG